MKKQNLTLIEMIFLLVIAATLGVVALTALRMARESARKISCVGNMKNIGLSLRFYSNTYTYPPKPDGTSGEEYFPEKRGRAGLQQLADSGFLSNNKIYTCPSTNDWVKKINMVVSNASYAYAGGMTESTSVQSGLASDRAYNHNQFGNILFVDGHVKGYAGKNWSINAKSDLGDFGL